MVRSVVSELQTSLRTCVVRYVSTHIQTAYQSNSVPKYRIRLAGMASFNTLKILLAVKVAQTV